MNAEEILEVRSSYSLPIYMEYKFRNIIDVQAKNGFPFNIEKAEKLIEIFDDKMEELRLLVEPKLPPKSMNAVELKAVTLPAKLFKKDGEMTSHFEKWLEKTSSEYIKKDGEDGVKSVVIFEGESYSLPRTQPLRTTQPMTLSNQKEVKEWLMREGWVPTIWNFKKDPETKKFARDDNRQLIKTTPKMRDRFGDLCPNLEDVDGELAKMAVEWVTIRHRRSSLRSLKDPNKGWLNNPRLAVDGRLSADADTCGTNTYRCRHRTVVNVPSERAKFGYEMRDLFYSGGPEWYCLGYDASGLEARMEGHYTYSFDNGAYATELIDGDVHSKNAEIFGVERGVAKNGKFALSYGCGVAKLAETLGVPESIAKSLYEDFWLLNDSLKDCKDELGNVWKYNKKKLIPGIDGRPTEIRSEHAIVNTAFQHCGALVMKLSACLMDHYTTQYQNDKLAFKVLDYHDEANWLIHKSLITGVKKFETEEEANIFFKKQKNMWGKPCNSRGMWYSLQSDVGISGIKSISKAGEILGIKVPLTGEYMIGKSWAETH